MVASHTCSGFLSALVVVVVLALAGSAQAATCDVDGVDAAAVAAARAAVQSECDCTGAATAKQYRFCGRELLRRRVEAGSLPMDCARAVRRMEGRSICGSSERQVCCRTFSTGRTRATFRYAGGCRPPRGGLACVSSFPHLVDACVPGGCATDAVCGNGVVEPGETCDVPDGLTCDEDCQVIPSPVPAPGTLVARFRGSEAVALEGIGDVFLAAFGGQSPGAFPLSGSKHVWMRRFGADMSWIDSEPVQVSRSLGMDMETSYSVSGSTHDGNVFHIGLQGRTPVLGGAAGADELFESREVPREGPLDTETWTIRTNFPVGMCRNLIWGPLALAPHLLGDDLHAAYRDVFACAGQGVLFEALVGVPGGFTVPPSPAPARVSEGGAALARSDSNVAGVWFDVLVASTAPPSFFKSLTAGWLEPAPQDTIALALVEGAKSTSPALAATGDVFLATWAGVSDVTEPLPTELRAVRFSREAGAFGPTGGRVLASGGGVVGQPMVDSDGMRFSIVWVEDLGTTRILRALRVGADGALVDVSPLDLVQSENLGEADIASTPAGTFVIYSDSDETGEVSVRVVRLPD